MDLIYKIYSVYLDRLDHDYLIFFNTRISSLSNEKTWNIGYDYSRAFNKINNLDKSDPDFKSKSLELMLEASRYSRGHKMIQNQDFLTFEKICVTHLPNYAVYNIYFNETKAGMNPHEYEVMGIWNVGESFYTSYRIWETKEERLSVIRDNKINLLC